MRTFLALSLYLLLISSVFAMTGSTALAQYVPMVPIPGVNYANFSVGVEKYLETLYIIAISAAALIAVGKLILAGFQYITSALVTEKSQARKDIENALIGLFIILIAVVILRTINPGLTNLPALNSAPGLASQFFPTARTTTVNTQNDGASRDALLRTCTNVVMLPGNNLCCNDTNACNNTPPQNTTTLIGYEPGKVYTAIEINTLIAENGGTDKIVMLYRVQEPEDMWESMCQSAAVSKNKEFSELVPLNQQFGTGGRVLVATTVLCIMK